jgi:hypothetical protein
MDERSLLVKIVIYVARTRPEACQKNRCARCRTHSLNAACAYAEQL